LRYQPNARARFETLVGAGHRARNRPRPTTVNGAPFCSVYTFSSNSGLHSLLVLIAEYVSLYCGRRGAGSEDAPLAELKGGLRCGQIGGGSARVVMAVRSIASSAFRTRVFASVVSNSVYDFSISWGRPWHDCYVQVWCGHRCCHFPLLNCETTTALQRGYSKVCQTSGLKIWQSQRQDLPSRIPPLLSWPDFRLGAVGGQQLFSPKTFLPSSSFFTTHDLPRSRRTSVNKHTPKPWRTPLGFKIIFIVQKPSFIR
jgi:hypothetical protein